MESWYWSFGEAMGQHRYYLSAQSLGDTVHFRRFFVVVVLR